MEATWRPAAVPAFFRGFIIRLAAHAVEVDFGMIMGSRRIVVLIPLLWIAVGCSPTLAQEAHAPKHRLGVDVGVVAESSLDELASPLIYRDVFAAAGLSYAFRGTLHRHRATFIYGRPRMTSAITTGDVHVQEGWQLQLDGSYTVRVASFGAGSGGLFAGAGIDNRFRRRNHFYGGTYSEWFTEGHSALAVAGGVRYRSAHLEVAIPLVAYVVRSPYAAKGWVRYRWAVPLRGITARASYERPVSRRVALHSAYVLDIHRIEYPVPSSTLRHGLVIGLRLMR